MRTGPSRSRGPSSEMSIACFECFVVPNGSDGCDRPARGGTRSAAIASANPPVKHIADGADTGVRSAALVARTRARHDSAARARRPRRHDAASASSRGEHGKLAADARGHDRRQRRGNATASSWPRPEVAGPGHGRARRTGAAPLRCSRSRRLDARNRAPSARCPASPRSRSRPGRCPAGRRVRVLPS